MAVEHAGNLVHLAAQADHHDSREIGVVPVAGDGPLEHLPSIAVTGHPAPGAVGERHDAVHMRVVGERVAAEGVGDVAADGGGAVHRAHEADIVAGRRPSVVAQDALEGRAFGLRHEIGGLRLAAGGVVARERLHLHIVGVHMVADGDGAARKTDDLIVFAHRFAGGDCVRGDLVPDGDIVRRPDSLSGERGAGCDGFLGGDHIVGGVEAYGEGFARHGSSSLRRVPAAIPRRIADKGRLRPVAARRRFPGAPASRRHFVFARLARGPA